MLLPEEFASNELWFTSRNAEKIMQRVKFQDNYNNNLHYLDKEEYAILKNITVNQLYILLPKEREN